MARYTYFDAVESLIVSSFGGPQDAEQRDIRTAVHRAYAELVTIRDWEWYSTHGRIITSAPYSTGTVTTSGLTVTLTGGTWPTWAGTGGTLKIGDTVCRVASRTSDTVVVLESMLLLATDVTDSTYVIYRDLYALPTDFRNLDTPSSVNTWSSGCYLTPDEAMKHERLSSMTGGPYHWTIIKDPDLDGWALKLIGYPTAAETIDFTYRRRARPIKYSGHEASNRAGTVSRSGLVVTGSGTTFPSDMIGSIMRFGTTTVSPGTIESMTPWSSESLITLYSSATSGGTQATGTISAGTLYIITDPLDIAPHMHTAMDSCAKLWLARIRGVKEDREFAMYRRDLTIAFEREQLAPLSGVQRNVYSNSWTREDDEG